MIQQAHADAKWFSERGLPVIREKIEAMAYGIREIPVNTQPPEGKYFEFHIKYGLGFKRFVCSLNSSKSWTKGSREGECDRTGRD